MPIRMRRGCPADLTDLMRLEAVCFEEERRETATVIANSLASSHQEIWVAETANRLIGAMSLRFHPHTCRLYSIAVSPEARGQGLGRQFLDLSVKRARRKKCIRIHLEVDSRNKKLIDWYLANGYQKAADLPDYYAPGWNALRLRRDLTL